VDSFIGGVNRSAWRKPFIYLNCIENSHLFELYFNDINTISMSLAFNEDNLRRV
jgi:hypothetical protein